MKTVGGKRKPNAKQPSLQIDENDFLSNDRNYNAF